MRIKKPLAAAVSLTLFSTCTFAQTTVLEEVIVTATKWAESLQDVPVATTVWEALL